MVQSAIGEPEFSAADCRVQLSRILQSADFEATARERRFLEYVVEESLAGRAGRIKAYSIAVEVFGRDTSFDPQNDPIVRIEAGHLRRSLERYYLKAGRSDPLQLSIPKGGYVPVFSQHCLGPVTLRDNHDGLTLARSWLGGIAVAAFVALAGLALAWRIFSPEPPGPDIPRLLVNNFESLGDSPNSAAVATGFTQEVISQLSKFRDVIIIESAVNSGVPPRYSLAGSVQMTERAYSLRVRFVRELDGAVLWAHSYGGPITVGGMLAAQSDIARNIASTLADAGGIIVQSDSAVAVTDAPSDWDAYSCTLSYYAYREKLDAKVRAEVRECLEKAVLRFPAYSTAWAHLAHIALDDIRFKYPYDPDATEAALDHALKMARRAVALDPRNTRALRAEMSLLFSKRDVEGGIAVGRKALAINPNDTDTMGGLGVRLTMAGKWADGCDLLQNAQERTSGPFGYYEPQLALCFLLHYRDSKKAAVWITKSPLPTSEIYHLIAAAVFGEAGMTAEAERERLWLEHNAADLVKNLRLDVSRRFSRAKDTEHFLDALRKAGFIISQ
jgi:TolB-like protein